MDGQPLGRKVLPLPPARTLSDLEVRAARFPFVELSNLRRVPYGSELHLQVVQQLEAEDRHARKLAPPIASEDLKTAEAEAKRLATLASEARKAALAVDHLDPAAFALITRWAQVANSAGHAARGVDTARERLEAARRYSKEPPAVTVSGVKQRRVELLAELELTEAQMADPNTFRLPVTYIFGSPRTSY
jgi:hypothetical protein